jgi:hypothetical protein
VLTDPDRSPRIAFVKHTGRLLLPHALIAAAYLAASVGLLPEPMFWTVLWLVHVALPIWCVMVSRSVPLRRVFLVGPGSLICAYVGIIAWLFWDLRDAPGHGAWLAMLALLAYLAAVGGYLIYCLLVFGVAARWRRRS